MQKMDKRYALLAQHECTNRRNGQTNAFVQSTRENCKEPTAIHDAPSRAWQQFATDLSEHRGNCYLPIADY